jgi:hypothetical protein
MKRILIVAVVIGCGLFALSPAAMASTVFYTTQASFNGATSTTLLETFEAFTPKDTVLASFTSNGVTYVGLAGSPFPNVYVINAGATNFGAGVGTTASAILVANGDEDFTATFGTPVFALGFDTYLNGLGPATVSVFNGTTLLNSFTYASGVDTKEYLGIVSSTAITSIRWTSTLGGRLNTGIDNISVNTTSVPEPSSALLLLTSGIAVLFTRLRKHQS